jgi:flagellar hook-associated protein 2
VDGIANKVQQMVDAANAALAEISLKADPKMASSPLKGNALVRMISSDVLAAVSTGSAVTDGGGVTTYTSFASIGVKLDKTGKLAFDKAAMVDALGKDPTGTQKLVQETLAPALKTIGDKASNTTTGTITQILTTSASYEKRLNDEINAWDNRLALRKTALQRQFTGLETALSKMKSQSSWLAGQLASLG